MQEMVDSVSQYGVLMPILVRPHKSGEGYEIISGHNRVEACKRAGIEKIPATIRELDDDTAIILMVDSNLRQRDKLLPSEKAKAYQMKMEALKRQGQRRDLSSSQLGTKLGVRADELIAEQAGESRNQVQRYIRLNSLTPSLLDCVDNGSLAFNPAVEISFLDPIDQEVVFETIDCYQVSPSVAQAQKLRKEAKAGTLTEDGIVEIMTEQKPMYTTITFRQSTVAKYFPEGTSGKVIEQTIIRLLEEYRQKHENKKTYLRKYGIDNEDQLDAREIAINSEIERLTKTRIIWNSKKKRRKKLYDALADSKYYADTALLYADGVTGIEDEYRKYVQADELLEGIDRDELLREQTEVYDHIAAVNRELRSLRSE